VTYRRLNITLPEETIRLLDRVAAKGERSNLIAEAVAKYVTDMGKARMKKRMRERAVERAELDLRIAEEWFGADREEWDAHEK
jgi:CopG family transcriptional regulator/antitoxin EndoAI